MSDTQLIFLGSNFNSRAFLVVLVIAYVGVHRHNLMGVPSLAWDQRYGEAVQTNRYNLMDVPSLAWDQRYREAVQTHRYNLMGVLSIGSQGLWGDSTSTV